MTIHLTPANLHGSLTVPPSKSMAHRMLLCAALANGVSQISNLQYSVDIKTTLAAALQWGAQASPVLDGQQITGTGGAIAAPTAPVHCAESGSTLRFLIPIFALANSPVTFTGAARLFQRPLTVYQHIFKQQGLLFAPGPQSLTIQGPLSGGHFSIAGNVSSQFISGLLFALPLLPQNSTLSITPPFESHSYVQLTRAAQSLFGVTSQWQDENTLFIPGGQQYTPASCRVEGDWSQGAVPAVLAAVRGGIVINGLNPASAQGDKAILDILQRCGAQISWRQNALHITPPQEGLCSPGQIDLADCPDLGPILCTLGVFCRGQTHIVNAGRLRIKESDRIDSMQQMLGKMGARMRSDADSIVIEGPCKLTPNAVTNSCNDHRVVMTLSAAAWCAGVPLTIQGANAIQKSWPGFFADFAALGATVTEECHG